MEGCIMSLWAGVHTEMAFLAALYTRLGTVAQPGGQEARRIYRSKFHNLDSTPRISTHCFWQDSDTRHFELRVHSHVQIDYRAIHE